jgi:hypothetical protein
MADTRDKLKGGVDNMGERAKDTIERVADSAERAGEFAENARQKIAGWAGDAGEAARQAGHKVQEWAGDAYGYSKEQAGELGKELTTLIRKHPIASLMIGFGAGLLLGRAARMV